MNSTTTQSLLESSSQQTSGLLVLKHVQHTLDNCNKDKQEKLVFRYYVPVFQILNLEHVPNIYHL